MTRQVPRSRAAGLVAAAVTVAVAAVVAVSAAVVAVSAAVLAFLVLVADPAAAGQAPSASAAVGAAPQPDDLSEVLGRLTGWLVGLLVALATLFATIGGLLYLTAGGDLRQLEKAKSALKSAAIGYALAALAPMLVGALQSIVGG